MFGLELLMSQEKGVQQSVQSLMAPCEKKKKEVTKNRNDSFFAHTWLAEVVSLLDPTTNKRIKIGCKGRTCDHTQCFDRAVSDDDEKKSKKKKNHFS